jgi:hypothetical protein
MSQEAKEKIAMNLNSGLPRLNGIAVEITLKINSENEAVDAAYFMNKMSSQLKDRFGFYDFIFSNQNKVATFKMKSDSNYSFPDLKKFVTESGYRVIEVSDFLVLKK